MDTNDKSENREARQNAGGGEDRQGAQRSGERNNRSHHRRPNHGQNQNRQGAGQPAEATGERSAAQTAADGTADANRGGQPRQKNRNNQNNQNNQTRPDHPPRDTTADKSGDKPRTASAPASDTPREARTVWSSSGRRRPNRAVAPQPVRMPSAPTAPAGTAAPQTDDRSRCRQDSEQKGQRMPGQRPPRMPHKAPHRQDLPQMDNLLIEDVPAEETAPGVYTPDSDELDRILQFELCTPQSRNIPDVIPEGKVVIVGVRFRAGGKTYFFAPGKNKCTVGQHAIVETARGLEYGEVCLSNRMVDESLVVPPLRALVRVATEEDVQHNRENHEKEAEAYRIGVQKINAHKLDMKLVTAQYTFDNSKLLFYFTSAGRVDFRELVRDLASVFHIRIELRQIGIRDEARMIGGLGACGRPLCCSTFLSDFGQVSMKMAKEQNLSLNSSKISGVCGRLMCCLRYEYDTYLEEYRRTPAPGTFVTTPDGPGVVTEVYPLAGEVKVSLKKDTEAAPKKYKREDVTVQVPGSCPGCRRNDDPDPGADEDTADLPSDVSAADEEPDSDV